MNVEARRLIISGLVQGVGFRYSMMQAARKLGITGWVRNQADKTVEALIIGNQEQLAAMLNWTRHGPRGAQVEHVHVEQDDTAGEQYPDHFVVTG